MSKKKQQKQETEPEAETLTDEQPVPQGSGEPCNPRKFRVKDENGYVWLDGKGEPKPDIKTVTELDPGFKSQRPKLVEVDQNGEDMRDAKAPMNRMVTNTPARR
jgi:hypothetical protein